MCEDTPPCECQNVLGMAKCFYIMACPEFEVARVECQIRDILLKPRTELDQMLIHGQCRNLTQYMRLCIHKIKEIKFQSTGEHFLCSGKKNN